MKKFLFLVLPLIIGGASLTSCGGGNGPVLTYGQIKADYTSTATKDVFSEITYEGLTSRTACEETMLVVTYLGTGSCGCFTSFKAQVNQYNKLFNGLFYLIPVEQFTGKEETFGMRIPEGDTVSFSIFNKGKLMKQWVKEGKYYSKLFEDFNVLRQEISKYVKDPAMYYTSETTLDNLISQNPNITYYINRATCPDCTFADLNLLIPYVNEHTLKNKIYILDIDEFRGGERYQDIKDKYGLSTTINTEYGYSTGVVPTFINKKDGKFYDSLIMFNDTVQKVCDKYVISDSYYNETMAAKLHYLNGVTQKVIQGLELAASDVTDYNPTYPYITWNHESAIKVYQPIFEAFMKAYF